ncbi:MAG: CvpA family protein [Candidatus Brocadia sp.]|nr:CvpA family protein [Candidatus Brocadia sp.]
MNWIDYSIFAIFFFAAALGLVSGPFLQFLRIGSLLVSFFTALFFYGILSNFLKVVFTQPTANIFSYFTIFGVAFMATYILTDIAKRIMGKWEMGMGLRLFGGLLGILKGLVFCGVIIFGVLSFCSKPTCDRVNTSKIATQIGKGMQTIVSIIPENISNKIKGYAEGIEKKNLSKDAKPEKADKDGDFKSSL